MPLPDSLFAATRYVLPGPWRASRRAGRHAFTVLSYQLAGEVDLEQNGPVALRAGDLHVIPAGHAHRITRAVDAERWSVALATERLDAARFAVELAPLDAMARGAVPRVAVPATRRDFVVSLFTELAETRPGATLRTESLTALLLGELAALAPSVVAGLPSGAASSQPLASRAVALIAARALGPLSLEDLAQALARSRAHVAEVVRRSTGRTVGELIAEVRLEEARRRLEQTDELVEVIGERVGYPDATHFGRMFKRRYGVAPRAWRTAGQGARRS